MLVLTKLKNCKGQASAEFAIVMFVLLIILCALALMSEKIELGIFVEHAISAASHNVVNSVSGVADAFNF